VRNIQSSKKITVAATGKDPQTGKMRTEEYTVRGPVAVMLTTTAAELEGETASRFVFLTIDESSEMTAAIHRRQRQARTLAGLVRKKQREQVIRKHQVAQRLLKPLSVVNDYTAYLSYPHQSLRTRRDHEKYLGLIEAIAYLHQYQRQEKSVEVEGEPVAYIEVDLSDIDKANRLASEVLGQSLDELARPSRTLLAHIWAMVLELSEEQGIALEDVSFTRRMIREHAGWSDWQVKSHIRQLEELEYVCARMGRRGKEYSYVLNYRGEGVENDARFCLALTPVGEIQRQIGERRPLDR
jgi:DNA primase